MVVIRLMGRHVKVLFPMICQVAAIIRLLAILQAQVLVNGLFAGVYIIPRRKAIRL